MFHLHKKKNFFSSPFTGILYPIEDAPDETFASKTMGDGFFVMPSASSVYAPADSTVLYVADTLHAICLTTSDGTEYLLHIGVDTAKLSGQGFSLAAAEGQHVKRGDIILTFDDEYIKNNALSDACMCIFTNLPDGKQLTLTHTGNVDALAEVCTW